MPASQELSYIGPRDVKPLMLDASAFDEGVVDAIAERGYIFPKSTVREMAKYLGTSAMDSALQGLTTTASISTGAQFLQSFLPGFVKIATAPRKIDELVGISTVGEWEDEEVIQGVLEVTGTAVPYTDYGNVPLTSWNENWERRTIVRFEQGFRVGNLEEMRAAKIRVNSAQTKRESAALQLDIQRNAIGFSGYNSGNNRTYGFLNDPNLPNYVTVAATGTGTTTTWSTKTFLNICADIRTAMAALQNGSQGLIDPKTTPITMALATICDQYLTTTSDYGISVYEWFTTTYPMARIVTAPQLTGANGGANVFYLYAENVQDSSTDDGRTWVQAVPYKFMVLGVEKQAKGYVEDYSNATAGVMLKRPFAVYRASGI